MPSLQLCENFECESGEHNRYWARTTVASISIICVACIIIAAFIFFA